jgi:hypothetical protein
MSLSERASMLVFQHQQDVHLAAKIPERPSELGRFFLPGYLFGSPLQVIHKKNFQKFSH